VAETFEPKPLKWNAILIGVIQILIALACLYWASSLLPGSRGRPTLPAEFWLAVAIALLCLGLAQINIVGPLREKYAPPKVRPLTLKVRLEPEFGGTGLIYPILSLAIAFGLPLIPLIIFIFSPKQGWIEELNLIWIGFALVGAVITAITAYLGLQRVYQSFNASEVNVEASTDTVKPEESFLILVEYRPGRLPVQSIQTRLICHESKVVEEWKGTGKNRHLSKSIQNNVIYKADLHPPEPLNAANPSVWQKSVTVPIPADARPSTSPAADYAITWSIKVVLHISGAPDITERYPFTVIDTEQHSEDVETL
jgi:hypothetical protein